ncbi:MAG: hypothetical protein V4722_12340 [Bacteroidota bacterium]
MQKKVGLLIAVAAAYAYYHYTRLTPEERKDIMDKGKDFLNKGMSGFGNLFGKATAAANGSGS